MFLGKEDHWAFLHGLEQVCGSHGWRVHAWVLMGNHFHLLLETPEANLAAGTRVLLGTFSQAWNIRAGHTGDRRIHNRGADGSQSRIPDGSRYEKFKL